MNTKDFDYNLPEELIAQTPSAKREFSRLMVVDRITGEIKHRRFYDCLDYLNAGDTLVVNDTRVIPARLFGKKKDTGGHVEILLLKPVEDRKDTWEALVKPGKKARNSAIIEFGPRLSGEILHVKEDGNRHIKFTYEGIFEEILDELGSMPLPPYIKEKLEDKERYQTVYSKVKGSAAAPTAGLHFTEEILANIKAKGVNVAPVTLHVGLGTFRPVKVENVQEHKMHHEYYMISSESANIINETKAKGNKVIAVGTTSVRTLETVAQKGLPLVESSGWTDIFIYPGFDFKIVDQLITNFHLPESTLMMLVSAFADKDIIMNAYKRAVDEKYRFFSFGDCMMIL